jgi:hypothetical protein
MVAVEGFSRSTTMSSERYDLWWYPTSSSQRCSHCRSHGTISYPRNVSASLYPLVVSVDTSSSAGPAILEIASLAACITIKPSIVRNIWTLTGKHGHESEAASTGSSFSIDLRNVVPRWFVRLSRQADSVHPAAGDDDGCVAAVWNLCIQCAGGSQSHAFGGSNIRIHSLAVGSDLGSDDSGS